MTRTTNARIAGATFLLYIAAGISDMVLSGRATRGADVAARLANIAQHANDVRVGILLGLLEGFSAVVLAVTLYAITREQDRDLAMLGLVCRVAEGVFNWMSVQSTLALLWLATNARGLALDNASVNALGAYLLHGESTSALFFAVGSMLFSWLLLRGRMIPVALAWLGVVASVLLVVILPLQLTGLLGGGGWQSAVNWLMWLPMLAFELALAVWFLIKGVAAPAAR